MTPLFNACRKGKETLVKYLLECGADANIKTKYGETPLSIARDYKYEVIKKYLLEHGTV